MQYSLMEELFLADDYQPINEAFNFKSVDDAKKALDRCKGKADFWDWLWWITKMANTPILLINGIPIPIFHATIGAISDVYALPGSAADKKKKHKKLIKKLDKTIKECEEKGTKEYKDLAAQYKKIREEANKEYKKWEERVYKDSYYAKDRVYREGSLMNDLFL